MTDNGMIEASRESTPSVIPEIFYRESTFLSTVDPGLKIAGVTRRWESKGFKDCGPLIETLRGRLKAA